jgi:zinc transport system substrate-binding protein
VSVKLSCILLSLSLLCSLGACNGVEHGSRVAVTIEPQRYFARRIGGDKFSIEVVVPGGQEAESYDPTPRQMVEVSRCRAYLRIGYVGFEQIWMPSIKANNPEIRVFDLSEGFPVLHGNDAEAVDNHFHPGGIDPHIWSSFGGAKVIAANTLKAFVALDPKDESFFRTNYEHLNAELDALEDSVRLQMEPLRGKAFVIYHPALTYFAREFGLRQLCIEDNGKEPSPAGMKELIDQVHRYGAKIVFVQVNFDTKNVEMLAKETGCRIVRINPMGYDWFADMRLIAKSLADE